MAKKHNWVTGPNHKVVEQSVDRMTLDFICSCNHLTPATEAKLDNLFAEMKRNAPETGAQTVGTPDPDVIAMLEAPELGELEPPPEAYEYDKARVTH